MDNPQRPKVQAPNWSEARAFAELIFGKGAPLTLQTFDDKGLDKELARHDKGRLTDSGIRSWLLLSAAQGAGIYFALNEHNGKGRDRTTYKRSHCVAVDLDGAPLPENPVLPFDIIAKTSNGHFHAYHLIQPTTNAALWTAVQSAMAERYNGDKKCKDLARVFRVPGFYHQKGKPVRVQLLHAEEPFPRPTLEQVAEAYGIDPKNVSHDRGQVELRHDGEDNERDIEAARAKLAATKPKHGERNDTAYKLSQFMYDHGISPDKQGELLHEWNSDIGLPDHEIDSVIEHAASYRQSPAGTLAAVDPVEEFDGVPIDPMWLPTKAEVEAKKKRVSRFAGMTLDQLDNLPPLEWSIEGLIPKGQLVELYGPPKAGKTFAAMDMGLCIATGRPYHGKKTIKGHVLHIVGEGNKAAIRDRVKAWIIFNAKTPEERKQMESDVRANWVLVGVPVHINEPGILREFFAANPGKFDLVIVDTLLRNMAGHISDPQDMAAFVHAAVDAILIFRRDGTKRALRVKEVRDGSSDLPDLIFELQSVTLSVDSDTLEGVKSAALKLTGTKARRAELTAAQKLLKAIHEGPDKSRADLAAVLGITPQAVSKVAAELRAIGYLPDKGLKLTPHGVDAAQTLSDPDVQDTDAT